MVMEHAAAAGPRSHAVALWGLCAYGSRENLGVA